MDKGELQVLLAGLGIPAVSAKPYADLLVEDGFDCQAALLTLTDQDLEHMGVKLGHRRLILQHICKQESATPRDSPVQSLPAADSMPKRKLSSAVGAQAAAVQVAKKQRKPGEVAATFKSSSTSVAVSASAAAEAPVPSSNNDKLAEIFAEMGVIQQLKRDHFRSRAYEQAAQAIRLHPHEIIGGAQARNIEGIGAGMARRIDIVLETGELEELKYLQRDDDVLAIRSLRFVHGIGPVRAMRFIEAGIRSLADLRVAVDDGRVHLNAVESIGLAHAEDFAQKIPRTEMIEHERLLLKVQTEQYPHVRGLVCGSYRRGARACGDIDFLMVTQDFDTAGKLVRSYIQSLKDIGYITGDLVNGFKYMGVCRLAGPARLYRRLDVRVFPAHQSAFGTLYFTGSKWLSIRLRQRAIELGMQLNEYGLVRTSTNEAVPATTERQIFDALGLTYLEPTER